VASLLSEFATRKNNMSMPKKLSVVANFNHLFCEEGALVSRVKFKKPYPVVEAGKKYLISTNIIIGKPKKSTATIKEIK